MFDLEPAARTLIGIVGGVRDDQLAGQTPCRDTSVADLLDHVDGLTIAFTAAAAKDELGGSQGPSADGTRLGTDWRARIPQRLSALARAWHEPGAWTGMTRAGGLDMPAEVAGLVTLDELVVHGWDIAVSTGQPFNCDPGLAETVHGFLQEGVKQNPDGTPGLFGPPVAVAPSAPLLDRVIGLTGRDPTWRAADA
jgi:uncharacterized protein (TIGR03086 family)